MTEGSKVTVDHRSRGACVYVRQSTSDQVRNNLESQRLQYGLVDRARDLGWGDVAVIDDDLGRSAGGAERPGFQRLLARGLRRRGRHRVLERGFKAFSKRP